MANDLMFYGVSNDGWGEAAAEYESDVLRGDLLKCTEGFWTVGKDGSPLAQGTRLVATATTAAWVKWVGNKPSEYRVRRAGENLPERDELGDNVVANWELGPDGQPRDPWQNTRFCYFIDPATAAVYTYSVSSFSGRRAVVELGDQITRMRTARPGSMPMIEFEAAPYKTKYGMKRRPVLKIVGWVGRGGGEIEAPPPDRKPVVVLDDMLNDSIPY